MAENTLGTAQLSQLFQNYSSDSLVSSKRNTTAYANDVYEITDAHGQGYIMRILKAQLSVTVGVEVQMQQRLAAAGIGTPRYLQMRDGNYVGEHGSLRFTLSRFLEGQAPTAASPGLIRDFGAMAAKLHTCLEGIVPPTSKMEWFEPRNVQADLDTYNGPHKDVLARLIATNQKLFSLGLPEAVIHADLWLGNVFADQDRITAVFDLETAERTLRIFELARTYLSMRLETRHEPQVILDALFTGYDYAATQPLTDSEKANFPLAAAYIAGVCATWHAVHGTRYTGPYLEFGKEMLSQG